MVSILSLTGPVLSLLLFSFTPEKTNCNHRLTKKLSFTNPLIRNSLLLLFTCSLAVLPVCVRSIFPPHRGYKLEARPQRITVTENHTHLFYTVNTSTFYIAHLHPLFVDLFCFGLFVLFVLFFFSRSVSVAVRDLTHHAQTCLTQQDMSVTGRIWKHG